MELQIILSGKGSTRIIEPSSWLCTGHLQKSHQRSRVRSLGCLGEALPLPWALLLHTFLGCSLGSLDQTQTRAGAQGFASVKSWGWVEFCQSKPCPGQWQDSRRVAGSQQGQEMLAEGCATAPSEEHPSQVGFLGTDSPGADYQRALTSFYLTNLLNPLKKCLQPQWKLQQNLSHPKIRFLKPTISCHAANPKQQLRVAACSCTKPGSEEPCPYRAELKTSQTLFLIFPGCCQSPGREVTGGRGVFSIKTAVTMLGDATQIGKRNKHPGDGDRL